MPDAKKNFAVSEVATAPSPATTGTSLIVTAGHGTRFPAVPFNAVIKPAGVAPTVANAEIVRVTAISTDTFTITRTQESTSARTVVVGDEIYIGTVKAFTDIETDLSTHTAATGTADPHLIMRTIYPVGGIYISTLSTNPNTLLGFGTWTAFGAGRVLVGRDSGDTDFDTAEETGGAKTHTHPLSDAGQAAISIESNVIYEKRIVTSFTANAQGTTTTAASTSARALGAGLLGNTDSGSTVQPYIVVYMWKRTA